MDTFSHLESVFNFRLIVKAQVEVYAKLVIIHISYTKEVVLQVVQVDFSITLEFALHAVLVVSLVLVLLHVLVAVMVIWSMVMAVAAHNVHQIVPNVTQLRVVDVFLVSSNTMKPVMQVVQQIHIIMFQGTHVLAV